ncbi:MAG TPA: hypothetical protein VGO34_06140 [Alphaproteobacteria bacterium]|jgi:hypothetical protein
MSGIDTASLPSTGASLTPPTGANGTGLPASKTDAPAKDERGFFDRMWGKDGFSFGALVDIVNPLQHIPVVGTIYRAVTGDSIGPAARIAGGALFGGVIGFVTSSIDAAVEEETGRDIGQHVLALHGDDDTPSTYPDSRPDPNGPRLAGDFSPDVLDRKYAQARDAEQGTQAVAFNLLPVTVTPGNAPSAPPPTPQMPAQAIAARPVNATPAAAAVDPAVVNNAPRGLPIAPRPHDVANGAGGSAIPLTTSVPRSGRGALELPTPQSLAADPAMLRQMQNVRPAANQPRNQPTLDTTIRPNGQAGATASFLDYTPKNAALMQAKDMAQDEAPVQALRTDAGAGTGTGATAGANAGNGQTRIDPATLPQVPADLISRMNVALEKYQTMQRAGTGPSVNVTQ